MPYTHTIITIIKMMIVKMMIVMIIMVPVLLLLMMMIKKENNNNKDQPRSGLTTRIQFNYLKHFFRCNIFCTQEETVTLTLVPCTYEVKPTPIKNSKAE